MFLHSHLQSKQQHRASGFTLVELLVVIALIGIIATIGVVSLEQYTEKAKEANARRTAQTIANVAAAAQSAGNKSIEDAVDLDEVFDQLEGGVNGSGIFNQKIFQTTDVPQDTRDRAKDYLALVGGQVRYDPAF